jgi:hypothetical protein
MSESESGPKPRPRVQLDGALFLLGTFVGMVTAFNVEIRGLTMIERGRFLSGWTIPAMIALFVMPAVFEGAQGRQKRLNLLSKRETTVLGPFLGGFLCSIAFDGVCRATVLFPWLPAFPAVVAAACALPFAASRCLWKSEAL